MSYILEALKKLERERQLEKIPDLLTSQGDVNPPKKRKPLWPYITTGLILLNAIFVFIILWVDPRADTIQLPKHKERASAQKVTQTPSPVVEEKKEYSGANVKEDMSSPKKKDAPRIIPSQPQEALQKKTAHEPPPSKAVAAQPPPPAQVKVEALPKVIKPAPPSGKILSIRELPADLKANLPEIKMTVHSYNEKTQSRFVVINNNMFREGQLISGDLKVDQITQNGVILNHQGHRFLLGINDNR